MYLILSKKIFDQEYFKSHWNADLLPMGTTSDEKATIKKCLQVITSFLSLFFSYNILLQTFDNELHLLQQLSKELLIYAIRTQQLASFWPILVDGIK